MLLLFWTGGGIFPVATISGGTWTESARQITWLEEARLIAWAEYVRYVTWTE